MAPRARPKPVRPILVSAEEKAARAQLVQAAQLGVVANTARVAQASKGAFEARPLRRGGTELGKYNIGTFANTYGNAVPTADAGGPAGRPGGATRRVNRRDPGARRRAEPRPKRARGRIGGGKNIPRSGGTGGGGRAPKRTTPPERRGKTRGTESARQRAEEAKRKAAAAARARRERERKEREKGKGTEKAGRGGSKAS